MAHIVISTVQTFPVIHIPFNCTEIFVLLYLSALFSFEKFYQGDSSLYCMASVLILIPKNRTCLFVYMVLVVSVVTTDVLCLGFLRCMTVFTSVIHFLFNALLFCRPDSLGLILYIWALLMLSVVITPFYCIFRTLSLLMCLASFCCWQAPLCQLYLV